MKNFIRMFMFFSMLVLATLVHASGTLTESLEQTAKAAFLADVNVQRAVGVAMAGGFDPELGEVKVVELFGNIDNEGRNGAEPNALATYMVIQEISYLPEHSTGWNNVAALVTVGRHNGVATTDVDLLVKQP